MSPLENILKCKHLFISRVRIEIILLYGELSLTRDVVGQMRYSIQSALQHPALITIIHRKVKLFLNHRGHIKAFVLAFVKK